MNMNIDNEGIKKHLGKQLEMFSKYLEDIPDYDKKIKAWEYYQEWQNLPEDRKGELIGPTRAKYGTRNEGTARGISAIINARFGFPVTEPNQSNDVVSYKDIQQIHEYCQDILDKDGELLSSKYLQKAA